MFELRVDEEFVPFPVADGDELFSNGIFVFSVTRILEFLARRPEDVELVSVRVSSYTRPAQDLDEAHVAAADPARPLMLAEKGPGSSNLIDGLHRVERARRDGVETLAAYRLVVPQRLPFPTSAKASRTFVAYWNDKVDELS